eukprot:7760419-Pyramimonas_sp.AAC.1
MAAAASGSEPRGVLRGTHQSSTERHGRLLRARPPDKLRGLSRRAVLLQLFLGPGWRHRCVGLR